MKRGDDPLNYTHHFIILHVFCNFQTFVATPKALALLNFTGHVSTNGHETELSTCLLRLITLINVSSDEKAIYRLMIRIDTTS